MKLTAENVESVVRDCLFSKEELDRGENERLVCAEGLVRTFGFHPDRLKAHEQDIIDMLGELPDKFKEGWSFLNGCMTKDDEQWGEQIHVEGLFALGCAIGKGKWEGKQMMEILPGGVPYYRVML
jgi:hypothetical protein